MGDQRLFLFERAELPEGVHLGERPLGHFTFADHLRGARQVLWDWITDGAQEGYHSYLITEDSAREQERDPKPIRRVMAMIYRDYLPVSEWPAFVNRFRLEPFLVIDVIEMERQRAWERRRHALLAQ